MTRWRVACDGCGVGGWIGPGSGGGFDAWCEGCQSATSLAEGSDRPACEHCRAPLTTTEPGFEELYGTLQNFVAVFSAWNGDPGPLGTLLPDRPRFLTDLSAPPAQEGDPPQVRRALLALEQGHHAEARSGLQTLLGPAEPTAPAHWWLALGIAAQIGDDTAAAEDAYSRALSRVPDHPTARLNRGALRARRHDHHGAADDLAHAGERREARWNRAAARVLEAVASPVGFPDAEGLRAAREQAGPPSEYWSDHTVGRLLWTAVLERVRSAGLEVSDQDRSVLRAAERELEFQTFWDRALVLHGYAALGMDREADRVAMPLAAQLLTALLGQPMLVGPAGRFLIDPLARATEAIARRRPADGKAALEELLTRTDLPRYRVACRRCARGTIGVEELEEDD